MKFFLKKTYFVFAFFTFFLQDYSYSFPKTIVFLRHGEKPAGTPEDPDFGHLNHKGLRRALKVPFVIKKKFGKPDYIFSPKINVDKKPPSKFMLNAPNIDITSQQRAFETAMPSLVHFNVPLVDKYKENDFDGLYGALKLFPSSTKLVVLFWEHKNMAKFIQTKINFPSAIWPDDDFDRIYVAKYDEVKKSFSVTLEAEGLNHLSRQIRSGEVYNIN